MPELEVPARPASAGEMKGRLLGLTSWGSYLFYLLPVALGLLYVPLYGVNVPYNEGWALSTAGPSWPSMGRLLVA